MAMLLYNEAATTGCMVRTPEWLGRQPLPSRSYYHEGPFLLVNGPDSDVDEVLRIPGYRLATAAEENEYTALKKKAGKLTEGADQKQAKPGEATTPPETKE